MPVKAKAPSRTVLSMEFGRAYDDLFLLEFSQPTSLVDGIAYINAYGKLNEMPDWDDEFSLEG